MKHVQNKENKGNWPHKIVPQWTKDGLIMFTDGEKVTGGHAEGMHDGMRDARSDSKTDWRANCKYVCTEKDWLDAGNVLPRNKPVLKKEYSERLNEALQHVSDSKFRLLETVDGGYKWNAGMFDKGNLSNEEGLIIIDKLAL